MVASRLKELFSLIATPFMGIPIAKTARLFLWARWFSLVLRCGLKTGIMKNLQKAFFVERPKQMICFSVPTVSKRQ